MKKTSTSRAGSLKPSKLSPRVPPTQNDSIMLSQVSSKPNLNNLKIEEKNNEIVSPYKNVFAEVAIHLNDSLDDKNDFKTPEKIKVRKKIITKTNKREIRKKKPAKTPTLYKYFNEEGFNEEHIQMAIAMSKSVETSQNRNEESQPSTESIKSIKETLAQFVYTKVKLNSNVWFETGRPKQEVVKRGKNSRFKYLTPILYLRTDEDRKKIIEEKINLILTKNICVNDRQLSKRPISVNSKYLQKVHSECNKIINLNRKPLQELMTNEFYVKELSLEHSLHKCGSLLKNWHEIPGRDLSPCREIITNIDNVSELKMTECKITKPKESAKSNRECISPDLFDSDDEQSNKTFENDSIRCSQNSKGIYVFETFGKDYVDLTENQDTCRDNDTIDNCNVGFELSRVEQVSVEGYNDSKKINTFEAPDKESCLLDERVDLTLCAENEKNDDTAICKENKVVENCNMDFELLRVVREEMAVSVGSQNDSQESKGIYPLETFNEKADESIDLTQSSDDDCHENKIIENCNEDFELLQVEHDETSVYYRNYNDEEFIQKDISNDFNCIPEKNSQNDQNPELFQETNEDDYNIVEELHDCTMQLLYQSDSNIDQTFTENSNHLQTDCETPTTSRKLTKHSSFSSNCSQESYIITDEELNYSSLHSTWKQTPKATRSSLTKQILDEPEAETDEDILILKEQTPDRQVIVKTNNVTPMNNYDAMDTPKIASELDKFGIKPLKRRRGVQLLKYIYEQTHPVVGSQSEVLKKRRLDVGEEESVVIGEWSLAEKESDDDLIFERKQSSKIASCRAPLQLIWHNFLSANPELHENILLYEPIQLEEIHRKLKQLGYNFHIEDLLKFFDKKCITVRTNQNNKKRHK